MPSSSTALRQLRWLYEYTRGRFVGGLTNTCYNAIDRHIAFGRGEQVNHSATSQAPVAIENKSALPQVALIYDSPLTGTQKKYTYRQLLDEVSRVAGMLRRHGPPRSGLTVGMAPASVAALVMSSALPQARSRANTY